MPGDCITSALPINDGMSMSWALDLQLMWDALRGVLEGGGVPMVEQLVEEDEEEEHRERPLVAGKAGPL